jgi:hypothetical protein
VETVSLGLKISDPNEPLKSIKFLLEQRVVTPEQQKWVSKLVGFEYEIVYRPGKTNAAADSLSGRMDSPASVAYNKRGICRWHLTTPI